MVAIMSGFLVARTLGTILLPAALLGTGNGTVFGGNMIRGCGTRLRVDGRS
jgi:hypothetical protein